MLFFGITVNPKNFEMEFTLKTKINTTAEKIYTAWLDSEGHSKMTGGAATIIGIVGEKFSAWDEYIEGKNLELEQNKKILQSWRTSEFEEHEQDSRLEILLNEVDGQTEITLIHTNLPDHGEQYKTGWDNHYFQPMKNYFSD